MKYLKLFESFEDIQEICKQHNIRNYTINKDGTIDVYDDVWLSAKPLTKLPLRFNKVSHAFNCRCCNLTSLEGSPVEVNGYFYCNYNKLTSFQYAPKIIRGSFDCDNNKIKSFEYFPSYIGLGFRCYWNPDTRETVSDPIWFVWVLFEDTTKIELLNDFDIFRDEDTETPSIIMDRLNDFLLTIGKDSVKEVINYKNI